MKQLVIALLCTFLVNAESGIAKGSIRGKTSKPKVIKVAISPKVNKAKNSKTVSKKEKSITGKIIDAGSRGFGSQLGRDAAKTVVKEVKDVVK